MANLLRMDLYRMRKAKSFWICLGIAFTLALLQTPLAWGLSMVGRMLSAEALPFPTTAQMSNILRDPFLMKLLLIQSICAILLLVTASFQNKSLGTVIAVLMGLGLMSLVYMMIDTGLDQLFQNKGFSVSDYMPDQLLGLLKPPVLDSVLVSLTTTALFLPLSVHVFDRRDVK